LYSALRPSLSAISKNFTRVNKNMKVHIVGAGPCGSIAAINAAWASHDVILSEEHSISGIPENCSGLFSKEGLESLSSYFDYRKHVINPINGANIHFVDQKLSVRRKSHVGYVCNRSAIDQDLVAKAEHEGAKVNYNQKISGNFSSTNIIGADGPISHIANHFSFEKIKRYATTMQATIPYKSEDPHMVEVFLSNDMFPGFFGWIIPQNHDFAEFGAGAVAPQSAIRAWQSLLKLKHLPYTKPRGWSIPIKSRKQTSKRHGKYNVLLVGDSAGQVKATTGGGMIFGGNCASIAGKLFHDPLRYDLEWRLRYGPDLFAHSMVHKYLRSRSDSGLKALGRRLKKLNCDDYLSVYGNMDRPTKMMGPQIIKHVLKNICGVS